MIAGSAAEVVAQLVLFLIAEPGKGGDGRGELVVTERFVARYGQRSQTERKLQGKAEGRVARLSQMQFAGIEDERAEPGRAECVGVADDGVEIVVMSGQSGRGQGRLLHQGVVRKVAVFGGAQEPLRLRSLGPVKTQRADVIAEGDGNVLRDKD